MRIIEWVLKEENLTRTVKLRTLSMKGKHEGLWHLRIKVKYCQIIREVLNFTYLKQCFLELALLVISRIVQPICREESLWEGGKEAQTDPKKDVWLHGTGIILNPSKN